MDLNFNTALDQLSGKLQEWLNALIASLPNLVVAVVVVVLFWMIARFARRLLGRLMGRVSPYKQVNSLIATIGYVIVLAAGVFVALGILDLDKTVTSLLAGAGILGLAIGFAFQDITANFISGILLSVRRPFREGELIQTNGYFGTVKEINLRATLVQVPQGQVVTVPNKDVFQSPIENFTRLGRRRVDLSCGVAYGDDLERAQQVAVEAIQGIDYRDTNRDVEFYYDEFGGSSVNFKVRFWIDFKKQTDFLQAQHDAIKRLKKAFDDQGITIPFPIRTLDFGVVGGEKLSEMLPASLYEGRAGAE